MFVVNIILGNDAVQTADDVAYLLRDIARKLELQPDRWQHDVLDANGNTVGFAEFTEPTMPGDYLQED
jgi:hypothetical protein